MASIYLRNGWYWISYYEAGKRRQVPLKTKDKKVARFKQNEIDNKLAMGDNPIPDRSMTVAAAFKAFQHSRDGRIGKKTKQTDDFRIETFLKEAGIMKINNITEQRLKEHLDGRIAAKNGISHRTANHTIRIVKTFMHWAVKNNLVNQNPIANMARYKINEKEPRFLSADEVKKILQTAHGSRIYPLIATAVYTGMRFSEMDRLNWEDIDFKGMIISVKLSKPGKFRKVPLHPDLASILAKERGHGKCLNTKAFDHFFKQLRKAAGIGHFRFHDLRHTFASLLIKSGVSIYTVSKLLGHSQVTTTQIYAHLDQDQIQEAIKKVRI